MRVRSRVLGYFVRVALLAAFACAPTLPAAYRNSVASAGESYSRGRYEQAAGHWASAAESAPSRHHRDEASYREASSWWRAGRLKKAEELLQSLCSRPGSRQARASFDLGFLAIERGRTNTGLRRLRNAVVSYPANGTLERAVNVLIGHVEADQGAAASLILLDELSKQLNDTAGEEAVRYIRALRLERNGERRRALQEYQRILERFPYPKGVYWDESSLRAADLHLLLGEKAAAVSRLRSMLREREPSALAGSYERRFSTAHYRLAELYRDDLGDLKRARLEFRAVASRYTSSRKRDDALWQSALLSRNLGESAESCRDLNLLRRMPDSRYQGCGPLPCAPLDRSHGECASYLEEEWSSARAD